MEDIDAEIARLEAEYAQIEARQKEAADVDSGLESDWANRARAVANGLTLNTYDEIYAHGRALWDEVAGTDDGRTISESASKYQKEEHERYRRWADENPAEAMLLEVGGGLLTPTGWVGSAARVGGAGAKLARAAKPLTKAVKKIGAFGAKADDPIRAARLTPKIRHGLGRSVAEGAIAGAASGTEGDRMQNAITGGLMGAGVNTAVQGTKMAGRGLIDRRIAPDLIQPDGTQKPIFLFAKPGVSAEADKFRNDASTTFGGTTAANRQTELYLAPHQKRYDDAVRRGGALQQATADRYDQRLTDLKADTRQQKKAMQRAGEDALDVMDERIATTRADEAAAEKVRQAQRRKALDKEADAYEGVKGGLRRTRDQDMLTAQAQFQNDKLGRKLNLIEDARARIIDDPQAMAAINNEFHDTAMASIIPPSASKKTVAQIKAAADNPGRQMQLIDNSWSREGFQNVKNKTFNATDKLFNTKDKPGLRGARAEVQGQVETILESMAPGLSHALTSADPTPVSGDVLLELSNRLGMAARSTDAPDMKRVFSDISDNIKDGLRAQLKKKERKVFDAEMGVWRDKLSVNNAMDAAMRQGQTKITPEQFLQYRPAGKQVAHDVAESGPVARKAIAQREQLKQQQVLSDNEAAQLRAKEEAGESLTQLDKIHALKKGFADAQEKAQARHRKTTKKIKKKHSKPDSQVPGLTQTRKRMQKAQVRAQRDLSDAQADKVRQLTAKGRRRKDAAKRRAGQVIKARKQVLTDANQSRPRGYRSPDAVNMAGSATANVLGSSLAKARAALGAVNVLGTAYRTARFTPAGQRFYAGQTGTQQTLQDLAESYRKTVKPAASRLYSSGLRYGASDRDQGY